MKEKLILIVHVACDDTNYRTYKSATQVKFNSVVMQFGSKLKSL